MGSTYSGSLRSLSHAIARPEVLPTIKVAPALLLRKRVTLNCGGSTANQRMLLDVRRPAAAHILAVSENVSNSMHAGETNQSEVISLCGSRRNKQTIDEPGR